MNIGLPEFKVEHVGTIEQLSDVIDWGHRDLHVPDAWLHTKGEDVVVMIIDTGYSGHPDVGDNELKDKAVSFVPDETDIQDHNGHHTHIAGIVGAQSNAMGVIGVAPKCKIISVKALNKKGSTSDTILKSALEYAISVKPDVINLSLGSFQKMTLIEPLLKKIHEMNIPVICAAGNFAEKGVMYPARYPTTISVGSYSEGRKLSKFSAYSPEQLVDFVAPGDGILSTYLDEKFAVISGTSMATPFVTGIFALLISLYKKNKQTYSVDELKNVLISNSIDLGDVGKDNKFGYGVIHLESAINQINNMTPEEKKKLNPTLTWREKLLNKIKWMLSYFF